MQRVDLTIEQGTTWGMAFPLLTTDDQPVDATGWTARAQVRPQADSSIVLFEWASADDLAPGRIEIANGTVTLYVAPAQSSAWTWRGGTWDLELTMPSGDVLRPVGGRVRVDPEVTR